jgi:hypothetical protein
MYASVNNSTDPITGQIIGYISNAGIPSISNQTVQELDVVTPYSVFPSLMFDQGVGLAWWKNIVEAKKMQSKLIPRPVKDRTTLKKNKGGLTDNSLSLADPYGSTESARIDGTAISSFVSWDSKITTVNGLLGGVGQFVGQKMRNDGIYQEFIEIAEVRNPHSHST